jgi:NDP-sugar pyrophosphorylase family protein
MSSAGSPTAIILAGGLGTRVSHLLGDLPKPMAPVLGRPFLEWVCRYLAGQGIRRILISTGYRGDKIAAHFAGVEITGVRLTCHQETGQLGTAGGFLHALAEAGESREGWLVCNGDSLVVCPLAPFFTAVGVQVGGCGVLGVAVADAARYGSLETGVDGRLRRFAEKKPGQGIINAGVYYFGARIPGQFPARRPLSFEVDVFPALLDAGTPIAVHPVDAPFLDIGVPASLAQATAFVGQHGNFFAP